ncbi:hypothetical protein ACOSQ2_009375 [Xanthoceras sorbifolium]
MARIMHIRSQLQSLKKGTLSITEFVVKIKGIVDSLTTTGQIIPEIDLVAYILGGLSQEFDPRIRVGRCYTTLDLPPASADVLHRIHMGELPENFLRENQNFKGKFRGRGRGRSGKFSHYIPTCQLYGKIRHFARVCYHRQHESLLPLQTNIVQQYGDYSATPYQKQNVSYFSTPTYLKQQVTYPPTSHYQQQVTYPSAPTYQIQSPDINALIATSSTVHDPHWYVDSEATNHITSDIGNLSIHNSAYKRNKSLVVGNGQTIPISHVGNSYFHSFSSSHPTIVLKNILFVPNITKNLLNISQLLKDNNLTVQFVNQCCLIKDKFSNQVLL